MKAIRNRKRELRHQKKLWIFTSLLLFLLGGFFVIRAITPEKGSVEEGKSKGEEVTLYPVLVNDGESPNLDVAAAASFYWDGEREKMLYKENEDDLLPIASISKLMTALVVKENYDMDEPVLITEEDVVTRSEFRDFRAFYETKIGEMIYPMVIESNNSAAFALALISDRFLEETDEDPVKSFVNKMNRKARNIGLKETKFINPSGLDGRGSYNLSTAREIIDFSKYLLTETEIFEISQKPSYRLFSPDRMVYYESVNTNDFLHTSSPKWDSIVGGKTGWTHAAFGCLLLVLEAPEEDGYIINVILGAEDRFLEMEKLVDYVHVAYEF